MFIVKIWWRIWGVIIAHLRTKKKGVPCWSSVLSVSKVGSSNDHMEIFSMGLCHVTVVWLSPPDFVGQNQSEKSEEVIWERLNKMPIMPQEGMLCIKVEKSF